MASMNVPGGGKKRDRHRVGLRRGYSQMDWIKLGKTSNNLSGRGGGSLRADITMEEVMQHNHVNDAWTVLQGRVYNITPYMQFHPGGVEELMRGVGGDSTVWFNEVHPWVATSMIHDLCIGVLATTTAAAAGGGTARPRPMMPPPPQEGEGESKMNDAVALSALEFRGIVLRERVPLTPDSYLFRFALPGGDGSLKSGLAVGQHVIARLCDAGNREIHRQYTPVSDPSATGQLDMVVKVYNGGAFTPRLDAMSPGDILEVRGPCGGFEYAGGGAVRFGAGRGMQASHVAMIAGGSGITPMIQVLRCALADENDPTRITLVFSNRTPSDIILRDELESLVEAHPHRFTLHLMLSRPDDVQGGEAAGGDDEEEAKPAAAWPEGNTGRVSLACLRRQLPTFAADVCVLFCGSPGFNATVREALSALHFHSGQYFSF